MKALLSILREFVDLPDDPADIAVAMNNLGIAVESIDVVGAPINGVVTAAIRRMERHPDAAKVTRVWVDAGDGAERHVWCGATNMSPGDVVPLATLGTIMPDGRDILRRGILGIDSEGMLCSPAELGLSQESSGLLVLPADTALGISPFAALGIAHDVVFDLDITRNRPDCMGHLGIARDLAAYFKVPLRRRHIHEAPMVAGRSCHIDIAAPERCGLFTLQILTGVRVAPSPSWVANRLSALGMRPINNVVDASNLVMLELNQPNHAYDADVVSSFRIRLAQSNEKITTLDAVERHMSEDDLLICDASSNAPVGMAGVMGGLHSEITDSTTTLALEIAWFAPDPIRFASQRHGLRSEASSRFERGVDPEGVEESIRRFVTILAETCPDIAHAGGLVSESTSHVPTKTMVDLPLNLVERTLGKPFTGVEIANLIEPIGFEVDLSSSDPKVTIPTWRPDCVDAIDIVEEIARHFGYVNLGSSIPRSAVHGGLSHVQVRRRLLRRVLVGLGLDEAMPTPLLAPGELAATGLAEDSSAVLRIANPLVVEESVLRTSLRPGLLKAVRYNLAHRVERIGLWEIGHVYPPGDGQLPDETEMLCVVVARAGVEEAVEQWSKIADALGVGGNVEQSIVPPGFHRTRSASITRGKKVVGRVGEIDPAVLVEMGIDVRVSCLEIDLSVVLPEVPKVPVAKDLNRLPSSDFDLAFLVPDAVTALQLQRTLRQAAGECLVSIRMFDVYRGQTDSAGTRGLAFRLRVQGPRTTLTEGDLAAIRMKCISSAEKLGATLR